MAAGCIRLQLGAAANLQKSGFDTFMTTKISWNQFNRMPHDTFKWRGIDGSEVVTHFITTPDDWEEANSFFYTYNGLVSADTVKGAWDAYQDKEVNQEMLLSYGYGDGGGGVNREMLEMRRRLDDMPGLPNVKTGRADDYFKRLVKTVEESDRYVHVWDGELYLEYHRGTYTSQAYNKKMNRKLELQLRETEWLNALAAVARKDWSQYPQEALNQAGPLCCATNSMTLSRAPRLQKCTRTAARNTQKHSSWPIRHGMGLQAPLATVKLRRQSADRAEQLALGAQRPCPAGRRSSACGQCVVRP